MEPGKPDFNYLPFKVHNNIVYLAGQLAKENGAVKNIGRVVESITEEEASRQMSLCATHAFSWLEIAAKNNNSEIESILDKDLIAVSTNKHPKLLKEYLGKRVSLESMVILNSILQFHKVWNVKLEEDYAWKDVYKLMNDYNSFLKFDTKSFKLILKGLMNG